MDKTCVLERKTIEDVAGEPMFELDSAEWQGCLNVRESEYLTLGDAAPIHQQLPTGSRQPLVSHRSLGFLLLGLGGALFFQGFLGLFLLALFLIHTFGHGILSMWVVRLGLTRHLIVTRTAFLSRNAAIDQRFDT